MALLFSQFTSVSHAHDHHEDVPVACDVCISAASSDDDDDGGAAEGDGPVFDADLSVLPASRVLPENAPAPRFHAVRAAPAMPDARQGQPRQTRAPPA